MADVKILEKARTSTATDNDLFFINQNNALRQVPLPVIRTALNKGVIRDYGRASKADSYSGGIWTINFKQAMDAQTVIVTPEIYGDESATIPALAILDKTTTGCRVKATAPCAAISWVAYGRGLDDVLKYGAFTYGNNSKYGHRED